MFELLRQMAAYTETEGFTPCVDEMERCSKRELRLGTDLVRPLVALISRLVPANGNDDTHDGCRTQRFTESRSEDRLNIGQGGCIKELGTMVKVLSLPDRDRQPKLTYLHREVTASAYDQPFSTSRNLS